MLCGVALPETKGAFLVGEWKTVATPFNKRKRSEIGIVSAVNALIDNNDITSAKLLYGNAREAGMNANYYIESRLKE